MKIKRIVLLLMGWCMTGPLFLHAQDLDRVLVVQQEAHLRSELVSLQRSLSEVERVYDVTLFYQNRLIEGKYAFPQSAPAEDLFAVLDQLLQPWDIHYEQVGARSLVLLSREELQETVRGTVTDAESGQTMPGVNVVIKGTTRGAATDAGGAFELEVTSLQDTLVFSFIGYQTRQVPIDGRTVLNIALRPEAVTGEEVVVVGYGTVAKSDLTGSVASVKAEELGAVPATSFDQALQGRVAGVQVTQTSGRPGGGTSVRIRGTNSITAGSEPLYVIDGMPLTSANIDAGAAIGPDTNPLATINPNNIESIEVLKDASATAIYGSRGANGVILITTKKGRPGRTSVTFDTFYGFQQITKTIDVLNAEQFARMINEAHTNVGEAPEFEDPAGLGVGTNWQDAIYRVAPTSSYQLSLSGGDEQTQFAVTGGYYNQKGIVKHSDFNRYSFRVNLNRDMNERLRIGNNFSINRVASNGVLTNANALRPGISTAALYFNPIQPIYDEGEPGGYTFEHNRTQTLGNPVAEINEVDNAEKTTRMLGNIFAEYSILENLDLKISFGIDGAFSKENHFVPNYLKRSQNANGVAAVGTAHALTWLNENTLTYKGEINGNNIEVLLGYTIQKFRSEGVRGTNQDFTSNKTGWHNLSAGLNPLAPASFESEWGIMSYLGRVNYNLDDKYLFTLTGRIDGSSKFGSGNKWGFFPSAAVAWRVSEEEFMEDVDLFSDLKLRASYGTIGNQSIPPYQSLAAVSPSGEGVFNNDEPYKGTEPVNFANPRLKWERTDQFDIGVDASLFDNRLTITADYYHKNTVDLLLTNPVPYTSGFTETLLNVGNMVNKGFEFSLQAFVNSSGSFSWSPSFNFSVNRNKVTNINQDDDIPAPGVGFLEVDGWSIIREGEPLGTFYGYIFEGIFQTDEEAANSPVLVGQEEDAPNPYSRARAGSRQYRDISGPDGEPDGVINSFDKTIIGYARPDFTWGFNNSFSFKNFNLSFFLMGSHGNKLANFNLMALNNLSGEYNVREEAWLNRWTPENPSEQYPAAQIAGSGNLDTNVFSSAQVEDASYIRLRNVTLGYNLPPSLLAGMDVKTLRIYVSGTNLLTFTDYSGYDPEVSHFGDTTTQFGADFGGYPIAKTYTFGINIGL